MIMEMQEVFPKEVLSQVAAAIPSSVKKNIIIVGSLAAAYWLFKDGTSIGVRTKDIDCVLSPHIEAVGAGKSIAETLLANGWSPRKEGEFTEPGDEKTADDLLPAIRLFPPKSQDWYIELLTEPKTSDQTKLMLTRIVLKSVGHFGLPSFPFLKAATYHSKLTEFGIKCALPEMMMLANLLENPFIKENPDPNKKPKRSNKDLGRVLAIARFIHPDLWESWPQMWSECLRYCFPDRVQTLVASLGNGLREMLDSPSDLQQAVDNCATGLLSGRNISAEQMKDTGERLIVIVIEEVKKLFKH